MVAAFLKQVMKKGKSMMGNWEVNQETGAEITVFCCEDTVDGIFTSVYDAWASKIGLDHVTVQAGDHQDLQLFARYRQVETDHEKAAKVGNTIRRRMGMEDYQTIYYAALAEDSEKGEAIFRTLVLGLAVSREKNITRNLQVSCVAKVFELARRVENESHRYRMFVRFHELEDDRIMFSEIEPENQVLPLLGDHFSDRFPMVNFMIFDRSHKECLIHQAGKQWVILQDADLDEERIHRYSRKEKEYTRLWKGFVSSIAIQERRNPRCQMNFMPKKFWKYMTEHQE